jgi:dTMP kinase
LAIGDCRPDVTVLLDLAPEIANERRTPDARDRFESADAGFHERVRQGYLDMAAADPAHWFVVDAAATFEEVSAAIDARLDELAWV